jgi:hypothetical protein
MQRERDKLTSSVMKESPASGRAFLVWQIEQTYQNFFSQLFLTPEAWKVLMYCLSTRLM